MDKKAKSGHEWRGGARKMRNMSRGVLQKGGKVVCGGHKKDDIERKKLKEKGQ